MGIWAVYAPELAFSNVAGAPRGERSAIRAAAAKAWQGKLSLVIRVSPGLPVATPRARSRVPARSHLGRSAALNGHGRASEKAESRGLAATESPSLQRQGCRSSWGSGAGDPSETPPYSYVAMVE